MAFVTTSLIYELRKSSNIAMMDVPLMSTREGISKENILGNGKLIDLLSWRQKNEENLGITELPS